jgi:hypothetical protein
MDKKYIWLAVGVIIFWYYSRKVQAAQALMVRYLLPQNIRISNGAVFFNQPIVITNPTGTPINLNRYHIQIQLERYPVGTAYGSILTTLNAAMDTTVFAQVVIPLDGLISAIPAIINAGRSLDLRFVGNIIAEFVTIPVDTVIAVPIPKLSK